MGVGWNAGAKARPLRGDYPRRTQRLAWERIRQACACCDRGHGLDRRVEAGTLVCPSRETSETTTEDKVIMWADGKAPRSFGNVNSPGEIRIALPTVTRR